MFKRAITVLILTFLLLMVSPLPVWADAPAAPQGGSLPPPSGLSVLHRVEDTGARIALTWNGVDGAFGYGVYRSESEEGPFYQVGGKAADSMRDYPVFLDETVEAGKGYYYAVTSVDADLGESPFSGKVYAVLEPAARAAAGTKSMICSLTDQRIYFFEGNQLVNIMRCSTGLNNATPTGNFHILGHYGTNAGLGGAICDYWMSFTSAHGMHAWPRGSSSYEAGLGAPASHGCIRLHPLEAYWPYNWAPDGTPLTITYASLARRVISGCHDSIGAPQPSPDWYFAEGYTALGYDTYLLLSNPVDNPVNAHVSFLLEGGAVVQQECGIAPHSRFTLAVDDVPQMDAAAFSIQVHADGPVVAERAMYFAAGSRTDGTVSMGATQLSTDWYFAEGYTAERFDTYLLLANPGDEGVKAWVYFLLEGGATVDYVFWIGPHSRYTVPVDALPVVGSAAFATHVHADGPVVAERAMYFNKGYIDGGHSSIGATQPAQSWYFAEGCTRKFFESYILVGNPGDEDAVVDIDYYLPDGSIRYSYFVKSRSRITIPINSQGGLGNNDTACAVYANHPVVAERAVYYGLDSHKGGHATLGSDVISPDWYFAEGCTDGAFDTYILLSNPGWTPARVEVGFQRDDGATFAGYYIVPAQRRVTVRVEGLPGLERASFSTVVHSDVPIMAERAMYFVMTRGY
jgi:hypothetical protein